MFLKFEIQMFRERRLKTNLSLEKTDEICRFHETMVLQMKGCL